METNPFQTGGRPMITTSGGFDSPLLTFLAEHRGLSSNIASGGGAIYALPITTSSLNGINVLALPVLLPIGSRDVTLYSLPLIPSSLMSTLGETVNEPHGVPPGVPMDLLLSSNSVHQHWEQTAPISQDANETTKRIIHKLSEINQMPVSDMQDISVTSPLSTTSDTTQLSRVISSDLSGTPSQVTGQTSHQYVYNAVMRLIL